MRSDRGASIVLLSLAVVALVLAGLQVWRAAGVNTIGVQVVQAVAEGRDLADLARATGTGARQSWLASPDRPAVEGRLIGMGLLRLGDGTAAQPRLAMALAEDERVVELARATLPENIDLAAAARRKYPENAAAVAWLGEATLRAGQVSEALDLFMTAAKLAPRDNLTWEQVGQLAEQQGQAAEARSAFGQACDVNPVRNGACMKAARLSYTAGDWAATIHYYVTGFMPEQPEDWVQLIRAARKLGQTAAAERYLEQAHARNPADYVKLVGDVR